MEQVNRTLQYYNDQAASYVRDTVNVEFSSLQNAFTAQIDRGGRILDLGCGSGRDSKAFLQHGFEVVSVDGSAELCKIASEYIGRNVMCSTFQEYEPDGPFDGIWACASLLHLEPADIASVMKKLAQALREDGVFYVCFKYGTFSGERNGRHFTDMTEETFQVLLERVPELELSRQYITEDARPQRREKWLNLFLVKK